MVSLTSVKFLGLSFLILGLFGCMSDAQFKEKLAKTLKENPKVLTEAIEKNPVEIITAFQNAVKDAQQNMAKTRDDDEKKQLEEGHSNPLVPVLRDDETIRGPKDAPLTLVEYSDFECPFCARGYTTVMELMAKYGNKIRFIYKHLPLSFHEQAMLASQYYEAVRLQGADKAFKFHDEIYKNQRKLKNGEAFLKEAAKMAGADLKKVAKDISSKEVLARIEADQQEAAKFGMQGTPGFVLNGVPVRGAYPTSHFNNIVEELKKRGKLNL